MAMKKAHARWAVPAQTVTARVGHGQPLDNGARLYAYQFVDPNPFPVHFYQGTLHLLPVTQTKQTFIEWYGDFDADVENVEQLSTTFVGTYPEFAGDLANYLASRVEEQQE